MSDYFIFNGRNCEDFGCHVYSKNLFGGAKKKIETFAIPGRNGTLSISDGTYENIQVLYSLYVKGEIESSVNAIRAHLNSAKGYARLEDSYEPDIYRLARFTEEFGVKVSDRKNAAIDIQFDCDPRRFLKSAQKAVVFTSAGVLKKQTLFDALPTIRAYGTGSFTINGTTVAITATDSYTDINCEIQEAYKGSENRNNYIVLADGKFPKLDREYNDIQLSGLSRLEITPNFWTI